MSELKPCPFCGGEARVNTLPWVGGYTATALCKNEPNTHHLETWDEDEAKAVERITDAWNTRAAVEYDDFFYLPKPKENMFVQNTMFSFDKDALCGEGVVNVSPITEAIQRWGYDQLNRGVVEAICNVFKPERTCRDDNLGGSFVCSECGANVNDTYVGRSYVDDFGKRWYATSNEHWFNYCPNCGARITEVSE